MLPTVIIFSTPSNAIKIPNLGVGVAGQYSAVSFLILGLGYSNISA